MKKKNKFHKFIMIGILYFIILLTISVAYSFFDDDLSPKTKSGNSTNSNSYKTSYILQEKKKEKNSYYYHFVPTLTYLEDEQTNGWKLYIKVPFDTEIIGCYNASSCMVEGETLTITNLSSNKELTPKDNSVTMGFKMKVNQPNYQFQVIGASFSKELSDPQKTENSLNENIIESDLITPTLTITGGWGKLSTYILKVVNNSSNITLTSWSAEITFPKDSIINSLWGGTYKYDSSSGVLTIQGPDWEPSLSPYNSATVNMHITTPNSYPYTPTVLKFTGVTATKDTIKTDIKIGGSSS